MRHVRSALVQHLKPRLLFCIHLRVTRVTHLETAVTRQMDSNEAASTLAPHVWGSVVRCLSFDEAANALAACDVPMVRNLVSAPGLVAEPDQHAWHPAWLQGAGFNPDAVSKRQPFAR